MKTRIIGILIGLAAMSGLVAQETSLTLDDRRFLTTLQTEKLPEAQEKAKEAAGSEVLIEVDWESVKSRSGLEMVAYTIDAIPEALASVARDEIGKEAVAKSLKSIKIVNNEKADDWTKSGNLTDGTLVLEWNYDNGSYISTSMLESRLNETL